MAVWLLLSCMNNNINNIYCFRHDYNYHKGRKFKVGKDKVITKKILYYNNFFVMNLLSLAQRL